MPTSIFVYWTLIDLVVQAKETPRLGGGGKPSWSRYAAINEVKCSKVPSYTPVKTIADRVR
jgi:hypothetical protein